ncbi:MAG: YibE/F family protein [Chloroflexi bacterium]|nr:YibE/F family protein [Chloroflexota bacterium]
MRLLLGAALALLLTGCGDLTTGRGGHVVEAHVVRVLESGVRPAPGTPDQPFQRLEVEVDGGLYRGDRATLEWRGRGMLNESGLLAAGDRVLLTEVRSGSERSYAIQEVVRLPAVVPFALLLVAALAVVGRIQGIASIVGLAASATVILFGVVPAIRSGADPVVAVLVGSAVVLTASVYVVHGVGRKSTAALLGTLVCLVLVGALSALAVAAAKLTGLATEEAVFVVVGSPVPIDTSRLVLAGIVVASLGALIDMSVGQASATFELAGVDPSLRGRRLYDSALNVGRDHIGSLVNTLAFAYAGASLPLIVFLSMGYAPLGTALNSEEIVEALLQAIVASIGLVLCVPVTTLVAVALVGDGHSV